MAQIQRIGDLLKKLAARTHADGTPKDGYRQNVADIRAELADLQARHGE